MIFTNNYDLPPAVFAALTRDEYDPGESDFSVTTILKPPREVQLIRRHDFEIVKDAMDMCWSVLGTAIHNIFEEHCEEEAVAEMRMYKTILDQLIGGQLDHYRDGLITDYKCTSVWSWIFGGNIKKWTEQQNVYAEIYRDNGLAVKRLRILCFFRDWKFNEYRRNPREYPPCPIMVINLEVWPDGSAVPFMEGRTQLQLNAVDLPDEKLPLCTEEEMWAKPDKYGIKKVGNKKASKCTLTEEEAHQWINAAKAKAKKPANYVIDFRPGERTKCERFCDASAFCNQYQEYLALKQKIADEKEEN